MPHFRDLGKREEVVSVKRPLFAECSLDCLVCLTITIQTTLGSI